MVRGLGVHSGLEVVFRARLQVFEVNVMNGDFVLFFPTEGLNTEFTTHVILLLN